MNGLSGGSSSSDSQNRAGRASRQGVQAGKACKQGMQASWQYRHCKRPGMAKSHARVRGHGPVLSEHLIKSYFFIGLGA